MRKMINTTKLKGFMGPFVQRRWLMRGDLISAEELQNKMDTYMCAYFFFIICEPIKSHLITCLYFDLKLWKQLCLLASPNEAQCCIAANLRWTRGNDANVVFTLFNIKFPNYFLCSHTVFTPLFVFSGDKVSFTCKNKAAFQWMCVCVWRWPCIPVIHILLVQFCSIINISPF